MAKLKIKNFGPIQNGFDEDDGFITIKKITIFIGNQATGKSTVAKIYSTLTWMEKALFRGDVKESDITQYNRFKNKFCAYQGLKSYFSDNTYIEYIGDMYSILFSKETITINRLNHEYLPPKIMYVPAERNFLSLVDNPEKLKQLPSPLYTFLEEFEKSKREDHGAINLPINNISFEYQKQNKISYIKGENYKIKLSEASSGIQSLLPVYLVSRFLAYSTNKEDDLSTKKFSVEEFNKLKKQIELILKNDRLLSDIKEASLELLSSQFKNSCFINIVEEMEQNLFPESQKHLFYSLLEFSNVSSGNILLLTTHSPYIINYLTLSIKAKKVLQNIGEHTELQERINTVVPSTSCIDGADTVVYELDSEGNITRLSTYNDLPSDENYLNHFLEQSNTDFYQLLEIETAAHG